MNYFDTSFVVPLFFTEPTSVGVKRAIAALPAGSLAISHWTSIEFESTLAREVRIGSLTTSQGNGERLKFETVIAHQFQVIVPSLADYNRARKYIANYQTGLRGGDALHLAIAANHNATAIYSLDKTFLKAGAILACRSKPPKPLQPMFAQRIAELVVA